ncbi:MAG TPA: prenyltransferase [Peptococcaceae bacterium]|nr:prenyltransferase [Bacillota bacterium]HHU87116.1 prenyltransferase [Peptococcaceae bacterium]
MRGSLTLYVQETRPQFLVLTPVCCLVGAAAVYWKTGTLNFLYLIIALVGGLAAHAAVNVLNDYHDYVSGLDLLTTPTPFSGGSGMLPAGILQAKSALILGLLTLSTTVAVGIFFLIVRGPGLLLVGLPGILLIILYTRYITRSPLLCLLAPGLGFGPCMVLGTSYVLQGAYDLNSLAASLIPGFLVTNLLLLNQFPDIEADRIAGRRHLLVLLGKGKCAVIYSIIVLLTYISVVLAVFFGLLPAPALIALVTLPLALKTIGGVLKNNEQLSALIPLLGRNVAFTLVTPFLLAVGMFIARQ